MIKNFFKIAYRNLLRNKGFSFINISGLAIGMASAVLILLWIQNEMSHDKFHAKSDRIYTSNNRDKFNGQVFAWSTTPKILGPTLKLSYASDVEDVVRSNFANFLFTVGDKHLNVQGNFVDSGFLNVFSFPLREGNATQALSGDYNLVITQKLAKKLFGNEEAMGKVIRIDSVDNFKVTGVLKDLPNNTVFKFEYLLPWSYMKKIHQDDDSWVNNSIQTYILLKPGISQQTFDAKIKNITINHTVNTSSPSTTQVFTQLFRDQWLYSKSENGKYVGGRIEQVKLFAIIAAFILLIACINFMNLSTARSEKRAKEVGIRKVVGAQKNSLIIQFISESILLAFLAGVLAIIIVELSLGGYNTLVGKELYIDFDNPYFWVIAIGFILFTGLLAGSYPAFYLSSYQPVKVLKGTFKASHALVTPRKVLVVLQFTFAIALIICTIVVVHQIKYAQSRDAGYDKDKLVYTFIQGNNEKNYELIKNELLSSGTAVAVTKSMSPITQRWSDSWGFSWPGSKPGDNKTDFVRFSSDADFVKTMGVTLKEGRDIDIKNYPTDSNAMLLNETAVNIMKLKNPVGTTIREDGGDEWHIVGVIKDFVFESPYQKIQQLMVSGPKSWFNVIHYRLNPSMSTGKALQMARQIFNKYNPQYGFDYHFVDDAYAQKFEQEKRTGTLAGLFAGLTIFISCLGLFGLATYMAENRIKEIGVRKVLGASVTSITTLLSKDFLKLVIISFVIASPIAWYAMNKWLQAYTYRVDVEWWIFAGTALLSIIIAILTVSYQAIKAAIANPVKSLRSE
ncbi:FtsX-like permease family protein [Ginsengibacter hankyongi]|uniref:FtsX-like permease family protein n=1 Tax=Ginsengibacter hankyongi TaxID=2607284 RepID=A0A5J5IIV2_9BACT|nr:ABC transporter permease [Ginsengibacter hankyongi]KAA9040959.1 FtsX-like permease family protein [Ginsengibacter hankyongi]